MTSYPLSLMRHLAVTIGLIAVLVAVAAAPAGAGAPMVIPQNQPAGQDKLTPPELSEKTLIYPRQGLSNPPLQWAAIQQDGYISIDGDWVTRGLVWDDVGSGLPRYAGTYSRWQYPLPGLYAYHCNCGVGERGEGKIYVVGPRPRLTAVLISPNNNAPVSYTLDASASSVTDWTPHEIVEYAFDVNEDGDYNPLGGDQVGPEPLAPILFATPGEHIVGLRVKDDIGRTNEIALSIIVPKPPVENVPAPRPEGGVVTAENTGKFEDTFKKANVKVTSPRTIKYTFLRRKGLLVKVTGLRPGDRVRAKLTRGKKTSVGYKEGKTSGTSITLRVKMRKNATRILLRRKPRAKLVRLGVVVSGSDGFTTTKARNTRFRR